MEKNRAVSIFIALGCDTSLKNDSETTQAPPGMNDTKIQLSSESTFEALKARKLAMKSIGVK